jgi:hypothetical protein
MQATPLSSSVLLVLLVVGAFISCSASPLMGQEAANILLENDNHVQRTLQAALDRWAIGSSRITFAGTVIELIFPLSDEVPDGSVSATTFSDSNCSVNITGNNYIVPSIIYDDNPSPDGTKNRKVTVRYDVDATAIQTTDVWIQDVDDQFFMNFCMSLSLHEGDADTSNTMSTIETVVRLQVDLVGGFGVEVDVL